ncbi:MAG: urease accessory protein UreE [Rhodobacterales bacterium]|jgi:urease accessory protein|nr:urease accessory protein UreE [Rhodobacterales bacterium]
MADLTLPSAHRVVRAPVTGAVTDLVVMTYDERMLRRKRLMTAAGAAFLVDLPETVSLDPGDALELADGRLIGVAAADEALMEVRGDLPRLAWHIGNRHAPCQVALDRLVIKADRVMRQMLAGLGAVVTEVTAPFFPEGGAYGLGRTLGHSHGDGTAHSHDHAPVLPHMGDHGH